METIKYEDPELKRCSIRVNLSLKYLTNEYLRTIKFSGGNMSAFVDGLIQAHFRINDKLSLDQHKQILDLKRDEYLEKLDNKVDKANEYFWNIYTRLIAENPNDESVLLAQYAKARENNLVKTLDEFKAELKKRMRVKNE